MTDLSHDLRISREALAAAERRADEAERACAAMKDALEARRDQHIGSGVGDIEEVLQSPIGSGWLSPEQGAEKDARIAELTEALKNARGIFCTPIGRRRYRLDAVALEAMDSIECALLPAAAHPTEEAANE